MQAGGDPLSHRRWPPYLYGSPFNATPNVCDGDGCCITTSHESVRVSEVVPTRLVYKGCDIRKLKREALRYSI